MRLRRSKQVPRVTNCIFSKKGRLQVFLHKTRKLLERTAIGIDSGVAVVMALPDVNSEGSCLVVVERTQTLVPPAPSSHWNLQTEET